MINSVLKTLVLASCIAMSTSGAIAATSTVSAGGASITSREQGMHQFQVPKGKLILINGTYQDVTTYKRSLTFYFESKPGADWLQVPVITSETDQDLTWFSISQGEQTVADAVVVPRGGTVELVVAETKPDGPAAVAVRWYRLAEYDDEHPYGPGHYFKKISTSRYPASAKLTVEQVLKKEVTSRLNK
jgi:hypothetical protein